VLAPTNPVSPYQQFHLATRGKTQGGFVITSAATGGRLEGTGICCKNSSHSNTGNLYLVQPVGNGGEPLPSEIWTFREVDATSP